MSWIPRAGGKFEGLELFVAPYIPPQDINVFGLSQQAELGCQFFRYLNDVRHGLAALVPQLKS